MLCKVCERILQYSCRLYLHILGQTLFLLYCNRRSIRTVKLDPPEEKVIAKGVGLNTVVGVTYHIETGRVYWADAGENAIKSTAFNNSNPYKYNLTVNTVTSGTSLGGIALDWIGKKIYWTDAGLDTIEVAELDGTLWLSSCEHRS